MKSFASRGKRTTVSACLAIWLGLFTPSTGWSELVCSEDGSECTVTGDPMTPPPDPPPLPPDRCSTDPQSCDPCAFGACAPVDGPMMVKNEVGVMTRGSFRKEIKEISKLLDKAKKAAAPTKGSSFFNTIFGALFANNATSIRVSGSVTVVFSAFSLGGPGQSETPSQKALREQLASDLPLAFGCKTFDDACAAKLEGMLRAQTKDVEASFLEFQQRFDKLNDCLATTACTAISDADRDTLQRLKGLDADAIQRQLDILQKVDDGSGKLAIGDSYVCSPKAFEAPGRVDLGLCTDGLTFRERGLPQPSF